MPDAETTSKRRCTTLKQTCTMLIQHCINIAQGCFDVEQRRFKVVSTSGTVVVSTLCNIENPTLDTTLIRRWNVGWVFAFLFCVPFSNIYDIISNCFRFCLLIWFKFLVILCKMRLKYLKRNMNSNKQKCLLQQNTVISISVNNTSTTPERVGHVA